jgi:hypothetical protein
MILDKPEFLLTRFTHGSAGKFLSTVLQTSDKVDHWSAIVQSAKKLDLYERLTLEYVNRSFPHDHSWHLRMEPMVPYLTDLYSTGYQRGNDVTLEQYMINAVTKNDTRLYSCVNQKLKANLIFNKPQVPDFCQHSDAVTVLVTSQAEKQWLFKTLWSKHFLEKDGNIHYLPSDPLQCNFSSLISVMTFDNPYCFPASQRQELYEKYIVNNHTNTWYFEPDNFETFDKSHGLRNLFINLEELLMVDQFLICVQRMFDFCDLGSPNIKLIRDMHEIWMSRQIPYQQSF